MNWNMLPEAPAVEVDGQWYATGWNHMPAEVEATAQALDNDPTTGPAEFADAATEILGTGAGKTALLFLALREVNRGQDIVRFQKLGDCEGNGNAEAVDLMTAIAIKAGEGLRWIAETATEPLYAGSRQEIGGGQINGDGSNGAWVAKWLTDYGALPRDKYGRYDLSVYDPDLTRSWGRPGHGVPDDLEPTIKQHPVKTASRVRSWEQCRDAFANFYPVVFSSNQGFSSRRDKDGFARAAGSWSHCMCGVGMKDDERPGVLILNSWGRTWISGPKALDQPDGSFWADAEVIDRMCRSGDCWAFSGYVGFKRQAFAWDLSP